MCLFNEAELNWVSTRILLRLELIQLEIGISTRRYLPAIGTAGLLLLAVKGYSLDPAPPPRTMAITDALSIYDKYLLKRFFLTIFVYKHIQISIKLY